MYYYFHIKISLKFLVHKSMDTLVEELSNCYDTFLMLLGFPHLFGKVFLITFKFSLFESSTAFLQEQCK